jgi:ArsR family transcriptional regulator
MAKGTSEDTIARMAARFRILADASRLAILYCLMEGGEMSVGQVGEAAGRHQANVSKHLKRLAEAGLLARRKEGLQVFYRLEDPVWEQVCRLVSSSLRSGTAE